MEYFLLIFYGLSIIFGWIAHKLFNHPWLDCIMWVIAFDTIVRATVRNVGLLVLKNVK